MARKKGKLHRMASSSHLQGNQKHKPADEQQRQSCICMFAYIYEEKKKHRKRRHIQRQKFTKEKKKRSPEDVILTSVRHSPTLTADLVRMTLVIEEE